MVEILRADRPSGSVPVGTQDAVDAAMIVLEHDARHVRRRVLDLSDGSRTLIDLPEAIVLGHGDRLVLDDGSRVRIEAAAEDLFDVQGNGPQHLVELAWHIGNRHLAAEIREDGIRILRDHVIREMLEGLGATVTEMHGPFVPLRGAYSGVPASHDTHHHHHSGQADHHHGDAEHDLKT